MPHIVIVSSFAESLINFRGDLIRDLLSSSYRVTAMAPNATAKQVERIQSMGAEFVGYHVARNGLSVFDDLSTLRQLGKIFRKLKPDFVLAYTIKPVVWSGIALKLERGPKFFPLITGLGYAFHGTSLRRRVLRRVVSMLYRISLQRAEVVFFQNVDNQQMFASLGLSSGIPSVVLPGSGVNLEHFSRQPLPAGEIVFLMIARLLGDKGVREYVAAASLVKAEFPNASFRLVGPLDSSPDGIKQSEVTQWQNDGSIEYAGLIEDVRDELANCHVYVLPSYHEGLPRTVLEAMATGRPVITTDAPGCRDTVVNGKSGFLVQTRSVKDLADRMRWFICQRDAIQPMGDFGYYLAESKFSVRLVNRVMLDHFS